MSNGKKEKGAILGITELDTCQPILLDETGQVIMRREKEMLDRIAKMEGQVKSWVDGLLDLNEKVRKIKPELELFAKSWTREEEAMAEDLHSLEKKFEKLMEFVDQKFDVLKKLTQKIEEKVEAHKSYHENLDVRIYDLYAFMEEIKKKLDHTEEPKGGWDVPGA